MTAPDTLEEFGVIISHAGRFELCAPTAGLWQVRLPKSLGDRQPILMAEYDSFQRAIQAAVDGVCR